MNWGEIIVRGLVTLKFNNLIEERMCIQFRPMVLDY